MSLKAYKQKGTLVTLFKRFGTLLSNIPVVDSIFINLNDGRRVLLNDGTPIMLHPDVNP